MTAQDLRAALRAWIAESEAEAAHPWKASALDIARKLAAHDGMAYAWRELAKRGAEADVLVYMVKFAMDQAQKEVLRPTPSDEAKMHAELLATIETMQTAIARTPMPPSYLVEGNEWQDRLGGVEAFHWRVRDALQGPFPYPGPGLQLCLEDVLAFAHGQASFYQSAASARPRTVERQRERPEINAFVSRLAEAFESRFGEKLQGTLAHIASAVFEVEISKVQVVGFLRTRCNNGQKVDVKPT